MTTCFNVAEYFLAQTDEDAGDTLSNLKLQKLCYYAQGFSLAIHGQPLFKEPIEAWTHGPVVPELYHAYKGYGSGCIPTPELGTDTGLTDEQEELLDEVQAVYGQFSAWKLRDMTHQEPPWRDTPKHGVITHRALRDYFSTQVTGE